MLGDLIHEALHAHESYLMYRLNQRFGDPPYYRNEPERRLEKDAEKFREYRNTPCP